MAKADAATAEGRVIEEYRGLLDPEWVKKVCGWNNFALKASRSDERAAIAALIDRLKGGAGAGTAEIALPIVIRQCDGIVKAGRGQLLAIREAGVEVIGTVRYVDDGACDLPGPPPGLLPTGGVGAFRAPVARGAAADRLQAVGILVGGFLPAADDVA